MKALVLGLGLQGKAVVHDLEQSSLVTDVVVADLEVAKAAEYCRKKGYQKARVLQLDATQHDALHRLVKESEAQVLICMLPADFQYPLAEAAISAGIPFASSSYAGNLVELDARARQAGVAILPEMGMDPGIDLILGRLAVAEMEEVHGLHSYGAGIPEPACAAENSIHYKISWTLDGVLKSYKRPARLLKQGQEISIPAEEIFRVQHGHSVTVDGVGRLDAYPNGDAIRYTGVFGLGPGLTDMGRFALRWPGHNQFWQIMSELGFLEDIPLNLDTAKISPHQFLVRHLTPRLQYREDERDLIIIRIEVWGRRGGRPCRATYELIDYRDLDTGLFAMNRAVGFTTSIAAQMLLSGQIKRPGVLSPVTDVPAREFVRELEQRGMKVQKKITDESRRHEKQESTKL
jgi:lysine 6-dehydrogenase